MDDKTTKKQERSVPASRASTVSLIMSMAEVTWRMFTPPAILVSAGIFADVKLHTIPWITLVSLPVSLGFSVMLVKRQLGRSI